MVTTLTLISQCLCNFSQPDCHHMCPTHIYICHVSHSLWKNLQVYIIEGTVQQERDTNSKEKAELEELCDNSMSLAPFLPKASPHTLHPIYLQEYNSLFPKGISNNMIFLFQKCATFDKTTRGRTWLASQDHPDYTRLIWTSKIKIDIIESQKLNYLIHKAIGFSRSPHSVSVKPSVTCAEAS